MAEQVFHHLPSLSNGASISVPSVIHARALSLYVRANFPQGSVWPEPDFAPQMPPKINDVTNVYHLIEGDVDPLIITSVPQSMRKPCEQDLSTRGGLFLIAGLFTEPALGASSPAHKAKTHRPWQARVIVTPDKPDQHKTEESH